MKTISVILPTFNDMGTQVIQRSLPLLSSLEFCEVIVVDRESSDGTQEFVRKFPVNFISTNKNARSERLNLGISHSKSQIVLLHHPRSLITRQGLEFLHQNKGSLDWGAFTHAFDHKHPLLNFTSWYSNRIRGKVSSIYYLDHCIFYQRKLLSEDPTPVPPVDIFEDTELCIKLRKLAKPTLIAEKSTTSSIRFIKNGILRQSLLNQALKIGFHLKLSKETMNKIYEKGLSLNSKY